MEYKCQRLLRDARIFSIYEGTTQLQVVAAIRYITNGTYSSIFEEMLGEEVSASMKPLQDRVRGMFETYKTAVEAVKAFDNQAVHDFLGRRLFDMTGDILLSLLIIRDASRSEELFGKSANVYVRMAAEEVAGHASYIANFKPEDIEYFKAR